MSEAPTPAPKKKMSFFKKLILGLILALIVLFILDRLGIPIGTISDDTQIIDPYQGN